MSNQLEKGKWLGAIIVIASFIYVFYRLLQYGEDLSVPEITESAYNSLPILAIAQLFLLCLNIFFETKKWQWLLRSLLTLQFRQSINMVLAGFASGIFTPAKIGEPVGRIMHLSKKWWAKATVLNYIGGIIQNIIIFVIGALCFAFSWEHFSINLSLRSGMYILFLGVIVSVMFVVTLKRQWLKQALKRFFYQKRIKRPVEELLSMTISNLTLIFGYSFLRYLIYNFQLLLLLWYLGYSITLESLLMIPVYFMLITVAPSFFIADLGVRGSVALFVFSDFGLSDVYIVLIVTTLWLLNQAVPALVGCTLILFGKEVKVKY
ncbi:MULTISPECIES: lysylphosphatidylglycerol synthase domain-containing protein [unclassified Saccharicrinis]|uniref:lysylphosphatidylglycerol synthase domain-containing protein n=1 Tax=unclassified Saccharicrinis TaxID=2646859 RepID=UPI003D324E8D